MPFQIGPIEYLVTLWVVGAVLLALGAIVYQSNIRVGGVIAWVVYLVFGSVGGFIALPLAVAMGLEGYLFILLLLAFAGSVPVIHWVMPVIAQDFQTSGVTASLVLAFLVGIAAAVSGFIMLEWRGIIPLELVGIDPFPTD